MIQSIIPAGVALASSAWVVTPAHAQWAAKVCSSKAASVTMQAGPSNTNNQVFATWTPGDGQKVYAFPNNLQGLGKIYFRATTPGHDQTDMCVLHNGISVKKMSFNGGNEDHDGLSAGDTDNCPC